MSRTQVPSSSLTPDLYTANSHFAVPFGTTADRPGSPVKGQIRYNGQTGSAEIYNGTEWTAVGGGGATGGGSDALFYEGDKTVTTSYTITTDKNALVVGPITVSDGVTITVPSGSRLVVV